MRTFVGLLGLALVVIATGCGGRAQPSGEKTIVAAFYPLAWIAEQVGGARVRVVDLTPAGAEPHDIELTPSDVQQIQDAALVLYLGNGFQPSVEKAVESRHGPSLDLLAGQTLRRHLGEGGSGEALDPHVWLDPTRLATMVTAVGRELGRKREAASLAERLTALDRELAAGLASCRRHEIVTSHAAFGYLAERYHLRQIALTGLSPEAEPSPKDLEGIVKKVERSDATTVFFETLVSSRLADTVAREAGVETAVLDPLEGLTPDEAAAGENYISIMETNLHALRAALGCR